MAGPSRKHDMDERKAQTAIDEAERKKQLAREETSEEREEEARIAQLKDQYLKASRLAETFSKKAREINEREDEAKRKRIEARNKEAERKLREQKRLEDEVDEFMAEIMEQQKERGDGEDEIMAEATDSEPHVNTDTPWMKPKGKRGGYQ